MGLLYSVTYFLPCIVCIIWSVIFSFRIRATTQQMMLNLLLLCIFYFATYAFYISPNTDYEVMAWLDMFNIPVVLSILALDLLFVWTHHSRRLYASRRHLLLYIPALVLSSINFLVVYVTGVDGIAAFSEALDTCGSYPPGFDEPQFHLYYNFNIHILNYVVFAYVVFIVGCCIYLSWRDGYRLGDVFRFFFCKSESTPMRVICVLNVASLCLLIPLVPLGDLGRSYVLNHPVLGCTLTVLLSVVLFCFCYVEYMVHLPRFTLSTLSHVDLHTDVSSISMAAEELDDSAESLPPVRSEEWDRVETAVRQAFEQDRVYTDPELSINSMALLLQTNRTTLSQIIGQVYGVNFRQLVSRYRIEEAKHYMLQNPAAKQEVVAMECGFATASSFNQKFKELTGDSPRIWLAKQNGDVV